MSNILQAFVNIVNNYQFSISTLTQGNNRANSMGEGLERFIQDAFANTFNKTNEVKRLKTFSKIFSYQGNQNNPPDLILHHSDAIEIKKLQSKSSAIALSSSYPKARLEASSPMITKACRECEEWSIKDMLYAIGYIPAKSKNLKSLWLVYGDCFCADSETYERIKNTISQGVTNIPNVEFTPTKELGKVKKVDPLGITDLRIRGMWHIANPNRVFDYLHSYNESSAFEIVALMSQEKYDSMPLADREAVESMENIEVKNVKIKNPNNPVKLVDGVIFSFRV
jgi:hypothetical protein